MAAVDYDYVLRCPTGHEYESAFTFYLSKYVDVKRATKEQDEKGGTDLFIERIPSDVTSAFVTKNFTICTRYVEKLNLFFGIRTGNGVVTFKDPVVVFGNNYEPSYCRDFVIPDLASYIRDNAQYIADEISDTYWAYMDSLEEF